MMNKAAEHTIWTALCQRIICDPSRKHVLQDHTSQYEPPGGKLWKMTYQGSFWLVEWYHVAVTRISVCGSDTVIINRIWSLGEVVKYRGHLDVVVSHPVIKGPSLKRRPVEELQSGPPLSHKMTSTSSDLPCLPHQESFSDHVIIIMPQKVNRKETRDKGKSWAKISRRISVSVDFKQSKND
ncbi:hypothetical protein HD554DRAFT_2042808 [Boletus coccyginus]|nr:hypothetical protein HD554DRAFT_2042808 [Boletus coccyginus]